MFRVSRISVLVLKSWFGPTFNEDRYDVSVSGRVEQSIQRLYISGSSKSKKIVSRENEGNPIVSRENEKKL